VPRIWRCRTQAISPVSVLIVNALLRPPQRPLRASVRASVAILMAQSPETLEGFSRLVFDLPPNPLASTIS
jgi:hypothetical protein